MEKWQDIRRMMQRTCKVKAHDFAFEMKVISKNAGNAEYWIPLHDDPCCFFYGKVYIENGHKGIMSLGDESWDYRTTSMDMFFDSLKNDAGQAATAQFVGYKITIKE